MNEKFSSGTKKTKTNKPMCKFSKPKLKSKAYLAQTQINGETIILILRPKVKDKQVMNVMTHRPKVIHSYAEYGMTLSKDKKAGPNTKLCQEL